MTGCLRRRTRHKSSLSEPRMQLVVMAAVLAMTWADQPCSFTCRPTPTTIAVKSCVRTESINTTMCEGQCYQEVSTAPRLNPQPHPPTCVCWPTTIQGKDSKQRRRPRLMSFGRQDPMDLGERPQQYTCSGDWDYEVKHFEGCLEGVLYPVARSCKCSLCQSSNTDCQRVLWDVC
ncbi:gonadotropin subunit beta-1-like isoform X1 [Gadus macrocephalus]|uniref:gonadotropin subunit beta-1-like isoform X1 n=2 Tax=Gadus macrocephalus TaxID=80720 RepID=UPI0028CB86A5|nr:gonadotropin subunit beta-1-like isoform X1 [Gadus macrocephalus]